MRDITLSANIKASGTESKPARISAMVYGGGIMRPPGWGATIINLAGLNVGGDLPILGDHQNKLGQLIGTGKCTVRDNKLYLSGIVSRNAPAGKSVLALVRDGIPLQASVGVETTAVEHLEEGEQAEVNGATFTAPAGGLAVVEKGSLLEVSLVALGADRSTQVSIAATCRRTENTHMEFNEWLIAKGFEHENLTDSQRVALEAAYNAETTTTTADPLAGTRRQRHRVDKIGAVLSTWADRHPQHAGAIEATGRVAISEGWSADQLELKLWQECGTFSDPTPRPAGNGVTSRDQITAAFLVKAGFSELAAREFGDRVASSASKFSHVLDVVEAGFRLEGIPVPQGKNELIRAAFGSTSTFNLPTALGDAATRIMLEAWRTTPHVWGAISKRVNLPDFREAKVFRPILRKAPSEIPPGGDLDHASATEDQYSSLKLGSYGQVFGIDRRDLINDDLSALVEIQAAMGPNAMRGLSDLWARTLLGASAHWGASNSYTNSSAALSIPSLETATKIMRTQVDPDGRCLDISPVSLLVPPSLEATALRLMNSLEVARDVSENDHLPTGNAFHGKLTVLVEPRLENTGFTGNSASTWYLASAPQTAPMIVGFLQGRETPIVEYFGLDHNPNSLSIKFRAYHDYSVCLGDPRCMVKMAIA